MPTLDYSTSLLFGLLCLSTGCPEGARDPEDPDDFSLVEGRQKEGADVLSPSLKILDPTNPLQSIYVRDYRTGNRLWALIPDVYGSKT
ncbi:hypothetical protein EAG_01850 [Camponotus floridanus]|uniref:Uncharacterized protein n=1 Tax=Camponotus floridanus TaxID=104421 RepID=E2AMV1_CAMFO|nr:hypothetical protein EAG_01850 [Camponotus floridanus]